MNSTLPRGTAGVSSYRGYRGESDLIGMTVMVRRGAGRAQNICDGHADSA